MTLAFTLAAIALLCAVLVRRFAQPGLGRSISAAVDAQDASPILETMSRLRPSTQPEAYNTTIRRLWNRYERELAAELIVSLGKSHSDTKIAQYWMRELLTSEPRLSQHLTSEFLAAHYRPEVAAQCGAVG